MKHHIIVKFNEAVADKDALITEIERLYSRCAELEGVRGCTMYKNCIARDNRFDLMIVLDMERDALPVWDASALHKTWKADYGKYIEKKAIFDCEN